MFENIAIFITLVECGSFSKTSEILKVSQSTISRKIAALEQHINRILILRDTRNMSLTDNGVMLYNKFKYINSHLSDYIAEVNKYNSESIGNKKLTVCLHSVISQKLICPYLKYYTNLFPNVDLNIIFYSVDINYMMDSFDIGISRKEIHHKGYIEKPIRKDVIQLYCTPQYITQFGRPNTLSELDNHAYLGYIDNTDNDFNETKYVKFVNKYTEEEFVHKITSSRLKVNTALHSKLIGMASSHIFWCWKSMCEEDVASGLLIPVLPEYHISDNNTFYLIYKENLSYEATKFCDFLYQCMNKELNARFVYEVFTK